MRRALVEDNDIIAGDDCICIKSGRDSVGRAHGRPTTDIYARNNRLRSCSCPHVFHGLGDGCGGLKIGTEMSGGVANVLFESNQIDYAGIALKLSTPEPRGGNVTNSTWRDIDIGSAGMAIGIDGTPPLAGGLHFVATLFPEPDAAAGWVAVNLGAVRGHVVPPPEDVAAVDGVTFRDIVARNLTCCPGCVDYVRTVSELGLLKMLTEATCGTGLCERPPQCRLATGRRRALCLRRWWCPRARHTQRLRAGRDAHICGAVVALLEWDAARLGLRGGAADGRLRRPEAPPQVRRLGLSDACYHAARSSTYVCCTDQNYGSYRAGLFFLLRG